MTTTSALGFGGSVPHIYHTLLEPLIFEPYARDIVARVAVKPGERILELACGTGIVTRKLADAMPSDATLLASDLNPAMLQVARERLADAKGVTFNIIDGCSIPLPNQTVDALVCQYGVMFFPDKPAAMREARRVLKPGGRYIFNVWDAIEHNPVAKTVDEVLTALVPGNPPKFLHQGPFSWHDRAEIERTVRDAGFQHVHIETLEFPSEAPTAAQAAEAWIDGTPLKPALAERGITDTADVRARVAAALTERFGDRPCRSTIRALVVTAK
ncbi:MAG TPA: methyltransferase domain-containing protein [Phycisphaerales bacterium]|nr:methyltransferase domain-containing protein [Phycisphaerales bacterium]